MMRNTSLFFLSVFTFGLILPLTPSIAQSHPPESKEVYVSEGLRGLFARDIYEAELLQDPTKPDGDFMLRLSSPGVVSGCAEMTEGNVEIKYMSKRISLEVLDPEIKLKKDKRYYGAYECSIEHNRSVLSIPLNRDEMIENNVEKFSLKSEKYGDFAGAEVKVTQEKIDIFATDDKGKNITTMWFLPKDTVILYAPEAKANTDVTAYLDELAYSYGLIPLEKKLDGFERHHADKNLVYYFDPSRTVRKKLKTVDESVPMGNITPTMTMRGPEGEYEKPYTLRAFAKLPGQKY